MIGDFVSTVSDEPVDTLEGMKLADAFVWCERHDAKLTAQESALQEIARRLRDDVFAPRRLLDSVAEQVAGLAELRSDLMRFAARVEKVAGRSPLIPRTTWSLDGRGEA